MIREIYVQKILQAYLKLPETPQRFSRYDRHLAEQLYQAGTAAEDLEAAFLLASARRLSRPASAVPLGPIRSLHYFLPALKEVQRLPLSPDYLEYLRIVLRRYQPQT